MLQRLMESVADVYEDTRIGLLDVILRGSSKDHFLFKKLDMYHLIAGTELIPKIRRNG